MRFERIDQDLAELTEKLFLFSEEKSIAQKEKVLKSIQQIDLFLEFNNKFLFK